MEQSACWEANSFSVGPEIIHIFCNLRVHNRVLEEPTTCPCPESDKLIPHSMSGSYILILSSRICLGLSSGFFPSGIPAEPLPRHLLSPIRATYPVYLILLDLINLIRIEMTGRRGRRRKKLLDDLKEKKR
jgi:hypothetical protein